MVFVVLFPGVPGGPELLIIFLITLITFGIPATIVAYWVVRRLNRQPSDSNRVAELESRVEELEQEQRER